MLYFIFLLRRICTNKKYNSIIKLNITLVIEKEVVYE